MSNHHHKSIGNIKTAFFLNLFFTVIEIIGGLLTNSLAIISDALHDLGDSLSLGLSWRLQKLSHKGSDEHFSYGYHRFSLLGAIVNSAVLLIGAAIVLGHAIPMLFNPDTVHAPGMIFMAILGTTVNGLAALRLRGGHSLNEKVVLVHFLEDTAGWLGILIIAIIMMFTQAPWLDPLLSIIISLWVVSQVILRLRQAFRIVLQGVPENVDIKRIRSRLCQMTEIRDSHDIHVWTLDGNYNILSIHVVVNENLYLEQLSGLKLKIAAILKEKNIHHSTIEFDLLGVDCKLAEF